MVTIFGMSETVSAISQNNNIYTIDFSKPITNEEQERAQQHYRLDSQKIFNEKFGREIYKRDQQEIMRAMMKRSANTSFFKEKNQAQIRNSGTSLGTYGDILVTYSFSSFGKNIAATGHAAIVSEKSWETVESLPAWFDTSKKDGVWYYPNNWGDRNQVYGVRVRNAQENHYKSAARYAQSQADARKKYNLNFFDKGTTNSFYCSQLVWRAWKNQGFEVDRMNLGDWEPVSSAELVGGEGTYVFYHKP